MNTTLVMIPVPPEEAKARMARAKQAAKTWQREADGLRKYGPKSERFAKKIAKLDALVELNDRIAIGCKFALDELVIAGSPDDTRVSVSVGFPEPELLCGCTADYICARHARAEAGVSVGVDEEIG